jgi:hypothetical protein
MCRLIERQSLASLAREAPCPYQPIGYDVDFRKEHSVLRCMIMARNRKEARDLFANLPIPDATEDEEPGRLYRHMSLEEQANVIDLKIYGTKKQKSIDRILNNSIFRSIFVHSNMCPWCGLTMEIKGLESYLSHINEDHKNLWTSAFSCPACMGTTFCNRDTYTGHWQKAHLPGMALMCVYNELNVGPRLEMGLALSTWLHMCKLLGVTPEKGPELPRFATAWGGYMPRDQNHKELLQEIRLEQDKWLPEGLRSDRLAKPTKKPIPAHVRRQGMVYSLDSPRREEDQPPAPRRSMMAAEDEWATVCRANKGKGIPGRENTKGTASRPPGASQPPARQPAVPQPRGQQQQQAAKPRQAPVVPQPSAPEYEDWAEPLPYDPEDPLGLQPRPDSRHSVMDMSEPSGPPADPFMEKMENFFRSDPMPPYNPGPVHVQMDGVVAEDDDMEGSVHLATEAVEEVEDEFSNL